MEKEKFGTDEAAVLAELLKKVDRQTDLILDLKTEIEYLKEQTVAVTPQFRRKQKFESRKKINMRSSSVGY